MRKFYFKISSALLCLLLISNVSAVDFTKEVKPILEASCVKCHCSAKDKGGLNLETLELSMKGGESGAAVVPGNAAKSLLIEKVKLPADHDDIMPPKGDPLTKTQIGILEKWIQEGAKWPKGLVLKESKSTVKSSAKKTEIKVSLKPQGHKVLAADKGIIAIIGYDGKVQWQHKANAVHDLQMLANGNVLFQINRTTVVEVDPKTSKTVFEYNSAVMNGNKGKKVEVHAFQRVENGLTMIAESGPGRIIEVDKDGKIVKSIKLKLNNPHPHRDTRQVEKLPNGNYLVTHEGDSAIREYDKDGNVVWEYEVPLFDKARKGGHGPDAWGNYAFASIRLPNGNTLIATGNGHSVIEVTPGKEIVWHLKQNDIKGVTLAWVTTLELLPNGNYMIGNCHAGPDNPQIIEITKNKELVWQFKDFKNFGNNLSNFQIIDAAEDIAFFNTKVHQVLEKNCLKCHGHSEKEYKGGLWLESRMNALKGGDISDNIVDWKNPAESVLLKHINWVDDEHQMPPKKQMSQSDIDILTEWVGRGLPYDPYKEKTIVINNEINDETKNFWSFRPLAKPQLPNVKDTKWPAGDIDKFILSKLEEKGMKPNDEADKVALVRRVYYDLTGLPPTPEEIKEFISDNSPKAYENLIDKLLASEHYGEKWGRHWLDVVRFAETNSYERDGNKPEAWKYRQWVIDSFNKDKPYDRMILEQLAGDELPDATAETITATGYYRLGIWDDEPADRLQSMYDDYDDIVKTTAEGFMGLTASCARCHNHKIDPFPMADYYGLLAFFHNIKPYTRGGHENSILTNVISAEKARPILAENKRREKMRLPILKEMRDLEQIILNSAPEKMQQSSMRNVTFKFYRETWDKLPDFDMFKPEETGTVQGNWFDISKASRKTSFGYVFEGELFVDSPGTYSFYLNSDDGSELFINDQSLIKYDGIHGMDKMHEKSINLKQGTHKIRLHYFQKEHGLGLYAAWGTKGKKATTKLLSKPEQESIDVSKVMKNRNKAVKIMGQARYDRYKALEKELKKLASLTPSEYVLSVRENGPEAPDTFILRRGSAHAKGPKVEAHFPEVLSSEKPHIVPLKNSSGRRLALAKWLVEKNPLTARVMANRIWQYHFGRGIVRSPNNFGMMGDKPTHPELLNYLAATFKENGWSIKKMHKLIMNSSTYKMSSKNNEEYYQKDPVNDLFWKFDMRRLTGEEIRDSILQVIGKLDKTYGGPSVYPKVSKEVLAGQSSVKWKQNTPESHQYRRSVYTFQMRSLIYPLIESFDAATPDASCDVRFITTQPTQALTMMNSELLNKSAELMAQNVREKSGNDLDAQMNFLWEKVTGNKVNESQIQTARDFLAEMKKNGASDERALQQLCLIMLNLNEFIYLD